MSTAKEPQKINCLTLEKKVQVIKFHQKNPTTSIRALGEKFECSKTQVAYILKHIKVELLTLFQTNTSGSRHIIAESEYVDVNDGSVLPAPKKHLSWWSNWHQAT